MTSHPPPGAKCKYLFVEGAVNESHNIYNSLFRLVVVTGGETTSEDLCICLAASVDQIIPGYQRGPPSPPPLPQTGGSVRGEAVVPSSV